MRGMSDDKVSGSILYKSLKLVWVQWTQFVILDRGSRVGLWEWECRACVRIQTCMGTAGHKQHIPI